MRLSLQGFFLRWVRQKKSHTSASGYIACLLKKLRIEGRPLAPTARERLHAAIVRYRQRYPASITRAAPIDDHTYTTVARYLGPYADGGSLFATQILALLSIGQHGMLRCSELMGLQWGDIGVDTTGRMLTVWRPLRKNNKTTISGNDLLALPSTGGADDSRAALARLAALRRRDMPVAGASPESMAMPLVGGKPPPARGGLVFVPMSSNGATVRGNANDWLNGQLRRLFQLSGLPPPPPMWRYSSHGMRRGGALMRRRSGAPEDAVMAAGQWRSKSGYAPYAPAGLELAAAASR